MPRVAQFPLFLLVALSTLAAAGAATSDAVTITVDFPDGSQSYSAPWGPDTTVLQAMQTVDMPTFTAQWYRSLNDWLVTQIGEHANQRGFV